MSTSSTSRSVTDFDGATNEVTENAVVGTTVGITAAAFDAGRHQQHDHLQPDDNDDGRFAIDASTGMVTVAGAIDREADGPRRNITVRATSATDRSPTRSSPSTINDVDEFDVGAITDSDAAANTVAENASIGTSVGITALAADADATNNTITYTLDDDAGGRFAINWVNRRDHRQRGTRLRNQHQSQRDRASGQQRRLVEYPRLYHQRHRRFRIRRHPDRRQRRDDRRVAENSVVGTTVGVTAFSDDADATDTITYSLDDNDGGRFAIDSTTGIVTVAGGIDREADGASRSITVRATSTDGSFQTRIFTIAIDDVDEFDVGPISDSDLAGNIVNENAANGTVVGVTALAADARCDQQHDYATRWTTTRADDSPSTAAPASSPSPTARCSTAKPQPATTSRCGPAAATAVPTRKS